MDDYPSGGPTKNPRHIEHVRYVVHYVPKIHDVLKQAVRI